jgi:hypothetical protein
MVPVREFWDVECLVQKVGPHRTDLVWAGSMNRTWSPIAEAIST